MVQFTGDKKGGNCFSFFAVSTKKEELANQADLPRIMLNNLKLQTPGTAGKMQLFGCKKCVP